MGVYSITERRKITPITSATEIRIASKATGERPLTDGTRRRMIVVANRIIKRTHSQDQSSENPWSNIAVKKRPTASNCTAARKEARSNDFSICNFKVKDRKNVNAIRIKEEENSNQLMSIICWL